jgi:hypothetical protein
MTSRLAVRSYILFQLIFSSGGGGASQPAAILAGQRRRRSPLEVTILFVPVSAGREQLAASWAERPGLDGLIDSLLATQHHMEIVGCSLQDSQQRTCLNRLANRLTKILSATRKVQTTQASMGRHWPVKSPSLTMSALSSSFRAH